MSAVRRSSTSASFGPVASLIDDRNAAARTAPAASCDERQRLVRDQDNLRKSIQVLKDSPEERKLRDRYVQRLTAAMERVDDIDRVVEAAQGSQQQLDRQLAAELGTGKK